MKQPKTNNIIVLDIDETLAHTMTDSKSWYNLNIYQDSKKMDLRDRVYTLNILTNRNEGTSTFMWGIKRPNLEEFLNFCFDHFTLVIVWSAGTYEYVHTIVPELFKNTYEPHFILTRDNCIEQNGRYNKPFWKLLKDIPEIYEYLDLHLDAEGKIRGFKNVMIIDDRLNSFSNDPDNGILIPVYEPSPEHNSIRKDETSFEKIMLHLNKHINQSDIRNLNKKNIFENVM